MMLSNMKQIAMPNGHARPIFVRSAELWNFQNKLGPGPKDNISALAL